MNKKSEYLDDISHIKSIMEKSSKFISLSGLSGILAGVYALIGATIAYRIIYTAEIIPYENIRSRMMDNDLILLLAVAISVLLLALTTGILLTIRKARKLGQKVIDNTGKRMLWNLLIPLGTGGIFILILFYREVFFLISPLTLIFYGLALVNASKFTLGDVRYLGYSEIIVGLVCAVLPGYGLYFWALGFGVLHIVYGTVMHFKYDR